MAGVHHPVDPNWIPFLPGSDQPENPNVKMPTIPQLPGLEAALKTKPVYGSPITPPALNAIHDANTLPPLPPRPVQTHALNPTPLNINDFKNDFKAKLSEAKTTNEAELKAHQKNLADIKTKKIALIILGVIGTLGLMTAIAATCVFCPPAGVALLAVGLVVVAVVGGYGFGAGFASFKPNLSKEDLQTLHQREDALKEATTLLEQTPAHGKSFAQFLVDNKELGGPDYNVDLLKDYISIYKKEQELTKVNDDVSEVRKALGEDFKALNKLGVRPNETQAPEQKLQDWQAAKVLEKEISQIKNQLKDLGVKNPENPQSANERLTELQQNQVELFKRRDSANPDEKIEINKEIAANKTSIVDLQKLIKDGIVGTIPEKQNKLDTLKQKQLGTPDIANQLPTIDQEIAKLKNEIDAMATIMSPYVQAEIPKIETRIADLKEISANIKAKEEQINKLINPHSTDIEKLEIQIKNELAEIKKLELPNTDTIPSARQKVRELKAQNKTLEEAVRSTPGDDDESGKIHKELSTITFNNNEKFIKNLEGSLRKIDKHQIEIDKLYDKVTPTADEIAADKKLLSHKINQETYTGPDLRANNLHLSDWKSKPTAANHETVEFGPGKDAIGIFGRYHSPPKSGYYVDEHPDYRGVYLGYSKEDVESMGRTNQNNFLSNYYKKDITIDGKTYASATHYLLLTKIDKDLQNADSDSDKKTLNQLKEAILKEKNPIGAYQLTMQLAKKGYIPMTNDGLYGGMENELKTVLFHKFVGKDGMPTEEGEMLLKTGNKMLYAGSEPDNEMYFGMQFTKNGEMMGANLFGNALMELRSILRNSKGDPIK